MASLTTTLRNTRLTAVKTALDGGGANTGKLKVYAGSVPANVAASLGGATLLCTLTAVTVGAASGGASTVSATADSSAAASGTPTFARFTDSSDTAHLQITAGISTGDLSFSGAVALGGTVSLTSGTLTEADT